MSYSGRETSTHAGAPIELYEFRRSATYWRYTSAADDQTYLMNTFRAIPIARSSIERTHEIGRASLKVTMPRDIDVAQDFLAAPPSEVTTLTVYRRHRDDADTVVIWMGRVLNAEWRGSEVEFNCEPVYTSLQRTGLRRMYQRACQHTLYGPQCQVNESSHLLTATVLSVSGFTLQVPAAASYPDGHFAGGFAMWHDASGARRRMITASTGATITLAQSPTGLAAGMTVALYPGCDHTLATCDAKFNNAANYGGFPYMPQLNPFGGTTLF